MRKVLLGVFAVLMLTGAVFAQVTAISDIQTVTDPENDDASPLDGQTVTIEGWVTFEPMSKGGNSFYVADAAGAWNGINVYVSGADLNYGFGWKLSITGEIDEYNGLTEIIPTSEDDIEVLEDDVDWGNLPAACAYTVVSAADLAGGAATAEQYESVLVMVEDVTCSEEAGTYGEWVVSDGTNDVAIDDPQDDDFGYVHTEILNQPYEYIRGILNYSYSEYKIMPEISFDLKVAVDPANGWYDQIAYFQQVRPMDMTVRWDDEDNDYMWDFSYASNMREDPDDETGDTVTVHGIVTMPTGLSYAGDGVKFILSDATVGDVSEPWSAVLSYNADSTAFPVLFEGDEVTVTGYISEYVTGGSNMTELWITEPITLGETGFETPTPDTVTVPELRNTQTAERWGNVMITTVNNVVTNNNLQYELFAIDNDISDAIPAVPVDDDSDSLANFVVPPLGANVEAISGWLYHHYGDNADDDGSDWSYKIEPLYPEWVILGEAPPNILLTERDLGVPTATEDVVVTASIADNSAVTSASIMYKVGYETETFTEVAMTNTDGIEWEGTIPAQADGSYVWYYIVANDDNSTSSTLPSDIEFDLFGYKVTETMDIYTSQYTPVPSGKSPFNGYEVTVTGVVTVGGANSGRYTDDVHGPAYFIQAGDSYAYSAIVAHIPTEDGVFAVGDEITVTGTVDETGDSYSYKWGDNTRLISVSEVTLNSSGNEAAVYDVDAAMVNAALESYESVQVEFENVMVQEIASYDIVFSSNGENFRLDDDIIASDDDELFEWFESLQCAQTITYLRGVITYSFGSWKIEIRDMDDVGEVSVDGDVEMVPLTFNLDPVYPNPFNPTTNINFTIPNNTNVKLIVYNSLGQMVRTLIDAPRVAGEHAAYWDGMNNAGMSVASGTYFLRLWTADNQQVQKMILTK